MGLKISNNGSFTVAIKELYNKTLRAYMAMKSAFIGTQLSPRIYMKLFDALVKPVALYGCEVWGAFGHKICPPNEIPSSFYFKDTSPYEQLHIRACKHILGISKHASNIGARAELGRLLLMFNIICSISKYRLRLESYDDTDLLHHALKSQHDMPHNSYKTITYDKISATLLHRFDVTDFPKFETDKIKNGVNNLMLPIKKKCKDMYIGMLQANIEELRHKSDTKLTIYGTLKTNYAYESYLETYPHYKYIAKFRLSDHFLPIERGRYLKPKLQRNERLCTLCHGDVGTEMHALFQCSNTIIKIINDKHMKLLTDVSSQFAVLHDDLKLVYVLKAHDADMTKIAGQWLYHVNETYKNNKINQ